MRTREIPFFVSFIYFFFNLACCSCLCYCGYRRLRVILVNLNCYFTLKALQKRFTVTPLPTHTPLSFFSLLVWYPCHFYAHYFAFAACLSIALCLLSIYNHNNNSKNNDNVSFYCYCTLWAYFDFYLFAIVVVASLVFTVCSRLVAYLLHFVLWCLAMLLTIYGSHKHPPNRV